MNDDSDHSTEMAKGELVEEVRAENAEYLGVSEERLEKESISEILKDQDIKVDEPHIPSDDRGGYFVQPVMKSVYRILTRKDYEAIRKATDRFLGIK